MPGWVGVAGSAAISRAGAERLPPGEEACLDQECMGLLEIGEPGRVVAFQELAGKVAVDFRQAICSAVREQRLDLGPRQRLRLSNTGACICFVQLVFAEAEALARAEVEALLSDGRKDRLAEVYRDFARELLKRDDPTRLPDFEKAHALLVQARLLARGEPLRARLLFEMARSTSNPNPSSLSPTSRPTSGNIPGVPTTPPRRFHLGEAQWASSPATPTGGFQSVDLVPGPASDLASQARLTWMDLARDLEGPARSDQAAAEIRARALYHVAITYGIPNPSDDARLGLGVAALRRFLAASPAHPLAVKAAYEVGASYLARGKAQEASTHSGPSSKARDSGPSRATATRPRPL